ncbi:hypothetical protein C7U92_30650 [Bradyrhizobium sp. WBOS7]|uniref:Uncharacterized protein n=1 Tax=Bradyrhizobium betae TaxID=244734 RepID=A0AAE9N902_9BRAD|nr:MULTISPECIES: hypothetical protein [Bradyrhizobium]MDD1571228.1 hypothetical protein [Bradyrhizobium sp. WBOS1]UUO34481.1 hypothetical protein DCK84_07760 [Bradyrhizobium sp. WBOS01]MDD1531552.1 hypothetical protein [Bradyrhizobium sp. WBOS2]MDD1581047.1 hypothetical protein [Bradyrhizobium sp. WBOS7]MDD1601789.1 hypothetical protein [Bradyrhizobium sp. WBOS16]
MLDKAGLLKEFELFSGNGGGIEAWFSETMPDVVANHLCNCEVRNIPFEILNQLLILSHEAGMSYGFFNFYFLSNPHPVGAYWYDPKKLPEFDEKFLEASAIINLSHLKWGLHRLYTDGLLYFGNIRECYRSLRGLSKAQLEDFFRARIHDTNDLTSRSDYLPLNHIAKDERYLIAEVACKTYAPADRSMPSLLEYIQRRYEQLSEAGQKRLTVKNLISDSRSQEDKYDEYQLSFSLDEAIDKEVSSAADLEKTIGPLVAKFERARENALKNTSLYLSMISDLDVYVATSMRNRDDFRTMAEFCEDVFGDPKISALRLRYFDPTMSAADNHEDKGLIECLMVKCSKMLIYNAGKSDSYGKDAEAAMALSLGKPVIFFCDTETKQKLFKDIHPLARLINFHNGVAVGSIVMDDRREVAEMVRRIFYNDMEFQLTKKKDGYFLLQEKLTGSTVRVQSNNSLLRETFWNYYHREPPFRRG